MVKAILYAADNGAKIINISSTGTRYSAALETAVQYAQDKGALVVAAAGNTGDGDNAVDYPAAFDGVLGRRPRSTTRISWRRFRSGSVRGAGSAGRGRAQHRLGGRWARHLRQPIRHLDRRATRLGRGGHPVGAATGPDRRRHRRRRCATAPTTSASTDAGLRRGHPERRPRGRALRLGVPPRNAGQSRADSPTRPVDRRTFRRRRRCPTSRDAGTSPRAARAGRSTSSFALQNPNPQPTVAHFLFVSPERSADAVRHAARAQFAHDAAAPTT